MTDRLRGIEGLALVAALTAVFESVHPRGDQFVQNSHDALTKGMHGTHRVYKNDGSPVEENPWRHGKEGRTCTASAYGRRSARTPRQLQRGTARLHDRRGQEHVPLTCGTENGKSVHARTSPSRGLSLQSAVGGHDDLHAAVVFLPVPVDHLVHDVGHRYA